MPENKGRRLEALYETRFTYRLGAAAGKTKYPPPVCVPLLRKEGREERILLAEVGWYHGYGTLVPRKDEACFLFAEMPIQQL